MSTIRKRVPSVPRSAPTVTMPKKKPLSKPMWDSTNSDLEQYKPSTDELERRRQACQSKNIELIKYEKQRQAMLKDKREQQLKSASGNSKAQMALLKEILYDDEQLKKLILKSDLTLKTVQDFFEEDNQQYQNSANSKKQAKINMTLAPNVTDLNDSNLPYNPVKPKKTQQRNSIYTAQAHTLNTFSDEETEQASNSDTESEIINMKLKEAKQNEDFIKYRQLLELKQELINKKLNSPSLNKIRDHIEQQQKNEKRTENIDNDKEKINRLKELIKQLENTKQTPLVESNKSVLSNLNDEFKRAMTDLENKMFEFEKEVGHKKNSECMIFKSLLDSGSCGSQSSYTLSLIRTVSCLLDYLKDNVKELNHEKLKNQETNKQLDIHRKLIDGLTNEILCVKEQNEKIATVYINQANHQAKIDAELDQIKIMIRSSLNNNSNANFYNQQKPPIIDSQPKSSSAFYPAQPTDFNNIIKPVPQQQMRPMSCVTSINDYNRQTNVRYPLDDALNEVKSDKFIERLNAMLHQNNIGHVQQNGPNEIDHFSSASCNNLARGVKSFNNSEVLSRSSESNFEGIGNNSRYSDFSVQIQELGARNIKAQQKLRQLQAEQTSHLTGSGTRSGELVQTGRSADSETAKTENLSKLKSEQQLLKEQINLLNKQRESAQRELESLQANNHGSSSQSGGSSSGVVVNKNSFMHNLQSMEFNRIEINQGISPNMSPIPNENIFQEGIEAKSSGHRFAMPSDVDVNCGADGSGGMQKKNRD